MRPFAGYSHVRPYEEKEIFCHIRPKCESCLIEETVCEYQSIAEIGPTALVSVCIK